MTLESVKLSQSFNTLMILSAVIRGSDPKKLPPFVQDVIAIISDATIRALADVSLTSWRFDFCWAEKFLCGWNCHCFSGYHFVLRFQRAVQTHLLDCVKSLLTVVGADCASVGYEIFLITMSVSALHRSEDVKEQVGCLRIILLKNSFFLFCFQAEVQRKDWTVFHIQANELLELMFTTYDLESKQELYNKYTKPLIESMQDDYAMWTQHSVDRIIFDTVLMESGESRFVTSAFGRGEFVWLTWWTKCVIFCVLFRSRRRWNTGGYNSCAGCESTAWKRSWGQTEDVFSAVETYDESTRDSRLTAKVRETWTRFPGKFIENLSLRNNSCLCVCKCAAQHMLATVCFMLKAAGTSTVFLYLTQIWWLCCDCCARYGDTQLCVESRTCGFGNQDNSHFLSLGAASEFSAH